MLLNPECVLTSMFSSLEKCKNIYINGSLFAEFTVCTKNSHFSPKANKQIIILN